jgi:WhiB family transcriptional regulator, redox-sensing transcriptional regulator
MDSYIDVITRDGTGWGSGRINWSAPMNPARSEGEAMNDGTETPKLEAPVASDSDETVESWQMFANCLGVDPDLFFPERGASTKEAKQVCQGCVVREDCLEYALANGEKFGIWGGLSERERRRIRRQRALARAAQQSRTA